ncbi:MAG: DUF2812 domain-containing protein [Ruminiclostridium sp.]|nr:DUF2812 domain-containing protein [Ruminiclostridium sp.]
MSDIIRHIPPCSSCDLEALESWLSDLAREGHYLKEIGRRSWHFSKDVPGEIPYRLVPGRGEPTAGAFFGRHVDQLPQDPPQVILDRYWDQGWIYVGRQRHCYIFRGVDGEKGMFRTEPRIWPEDVARMAKWEWRDLPFCLLIAFVAAPLVLYAFAGWGMPLLALNDVLWALVLLFISGLLIVSERMRHIFHLKRLQRKLENGERFDHKKDWKAGAFRNRAAKVMLVVLAVVWTLGSPFLPFMRGEDYNLLEEYPGDPPFPTVEEIVPGMEQLSHDGMYSETASLLIPVHIQWWENSANHYYWVDYYETLTPAMARELAEEILYEQKEEHGYEAEPLTGLDVDYAVVYDENEKVILQEGTKVMQVTLAQDDDDFLPLEVWTAALAESLQN